MPTLEDGLPDTSEQLVDGVRNVPPTPKLTEPQVQKTSGKLKTSGLAIAAIICSVLFFIPLACVAAIILGIMALVKIAKHKDRKGKGFAIAGIIIGIVVFIAHLLILILLVNVVSTGMQAVDAYQKYIDMEIKDAFEACKQNPPSIVNVAGGGSFAELEAGCFGFVMGIHANDFGPEDVVVCDSVSDASLQIACRATILDDASLCDSDAQCIEFFNQFQVPKPQATH